MSVRNGFQKEFSVFALVALLLSSCSHSGGTSSVSISFPSSEKLHAGQMTAKTSTTTTSDIEYGVHAAINISASDISTIYWSWNSQNNSSATASVTTPSATIQVAQGTSRLVQVLYVTQDSSNNLHFYYSDVTQDFSSSTVNVSVLLSAVTTSTVQGRIAGRYIDAAGNGPTGILSTYYNPTDGAPAMIVDQNEMFGGWFNAFSLPGQSFTYKADDGTVILANASASTALTNGEAAAYVTVPATYQSNNNNNNNSNSAEDYLVGYFGPGASGRKICFNSSASETISNLFTDSGDTNAVVWNGSYSACGANQACLIQGGDIATTDCSQTADYTNMMKFDETQVGNNDSILLFKGPFEMTDSGNGNIQQLVGSINGANLSLSWSYLPGATRALGGVEVFYKWVPSSSNNNNSAYQVNDGIDCANLVSKYGFISGGRFSVAQTSATVLVGSVGNSYLAAYACPYIGSRYFSSAAQFNGGSSSSSGGTYQLSLAADAGTSLNTFYANTCKHYIINFKDSLGNVVVAPTSTDVKVTVNSPGALFTGTCASTPATSISLQPSSGMSQIDFYFKDPSTEFNTINISAVGYSGISQTVALPEGDAPSQIALSLQAMSSGSSYALVSGECYPVQAELQFSSAGFPANPGAYSFNVSASGGLSGFFYTSSTCNSASLNMSATGSATLSFPSTDDVMTFYFSPNVTTAVTSGSLLGSSTTPSVTNGVQSIAAAPAIQGTGGSAYALIPDNGSFNFDPGACIGMTLYATNAIGAVTSPATDKSLSVAKTNGLLYSDSCGGTILSSSVIVPHQGLAPHFFFAPFANSAPATIAINDGSNNNTFAFLLNAPAITWSGPFNNPTGLCLPASFALSNTSGQSYAFDSSVNFGVTATNFALYSNPTCTAPATTVTLNPGQNSITGLGNQLYLLAQTTNQPTLSLGAINFTQAGFNGLMANFNSFSLSQTSLSPTNLTGTTCQAGLGMIFELSAPFVSIDATTIPAMSGTLSMSFYGGSIAPCTTSSYSSCSGTTLTPTFAAGALSSQVFYFQGSSASSSTLVTFSITSSMPGISGGSFTCP